LTAANSNLWRAIAWMMAAIVANTTELVLIHALGSSWPAPLQLFWRQAAGLVILTPLIVRTGKPVFATSSPKILVFRCVCATLALMSWIYATSRLPLATATTLSFTRPLFVVMLARAVLGEHVGPTKAAAVGLGFAGVLVMMRPGVTMEAPLAQGAALASSLLFALSLVSIKAMRSSNNALTIMIYSCILGVLFTGIPAAVLWRTPTLIEAVLLIGLGFTSLINFGCMLQALSLQGAASLMPLDFIRLPAATLIGFLVFNERPGLAALAGAGLIILSALTTALDGRPLKQRTTS